MRRFLKIFFLLFILLPFIAFCIFMEPLVFGSLPPDDKIVVSDITKLNPIVVSGIVSPLTNEDVQNAVRKHAGPVSIGGGQYSMGGQIATDQALFIDMRKMNKVVDFKPDQKLITVQVGMRWKDVQNYVDPYNLSVEIMQTYNNFTVGGSLSVNVHGRYIGLGPLIMSVRSIKLVLADGKIVDATPISNPELFYGAIGGYGGLGVITEATLDLADNVTMKRHVKTMPIDKYKDYFFDNVRNSNRVVFHNADIYPPAYKNLSAVTWDLTDEPLTETERFRPIKRSYWLENLFYYWITELPYGNYVREEFVEPALYKNDVVAKRNYEASYDVAELAPLNRGSSAYILQEYFVPVEKFDDFVPKMRKVLKDHHVNMVNISIRHANKDPGSVMAWARQEVFAFVMYYKQGTSAEDRAAVGVWTREMIDAVISVGGRYYLPYQPYATQNQFHAAYPDADKFFALKQKYDPTYKFRNKLWDKYYWPVPKDRELAQKSEDTPGYSRTEDQTYLTVPEWYLVFSPEEYAEALKGPPSAYPYFGSIRQFWGLYKKIKQRTQSEYPPNPGYNLMINVIGISTAVELSVEGVYENTLGRLTELVSDRRDLKPSMKVETFMQETESDYVSFIKVRPWYKYPFYKKFKELTEVKESPETSKLRSFERRIYFGSMLLFKTAYGKVIERATHATYEAPEPEITWALVQHTNGTKELVSFPRYQAFTTAAIKAADQGNRFIEIAGNKNILLTVITPEDWHYNGTGETFIEWPILTQPEKKRTALVLDVNSLSAFIKQTESDPVVKLDHIFDY